MLSTIQNFCIKLLGGVPYEYYEAVCAQEKDIREECERVKSLSYEQRDTIHTLNLNVQRGEDALAFFMDRLGRDEVGRIVNEEKAEKLLFDLGPPVITGDECPMTSYTILTAEFERQRITIAGGESQANPRFLSLVARTADMLGRRMANHIKARFGVAIFEKEPS